MSRAGGVVSAGTEETARAGIEMLEAGGNAFDAAVAAAFASFVCEPALTSLAGGGFLMAKKSGGAISLYDFFTAVPGLGRDNNRDSVNFHSVDVNFSDTTQEFHVGEGSAAVPGNAAGLALVHKELCSLPIEKILEPAIRYARDGIKLSPRQAGFLKILTPILTLTEEGRSFFAPGGEILSEGDILVNPLLADTLESLLRDGLESFYNGPLSRSIVEGFSKKGFLTEEDLRSYRVYKREPVMVIYRGRQVYTNPPPSSGGTLIAFTLSLLEGFDLGAMKHNGADYLKLLSEVKRVTNEARREKLDECLFKEGLTDIFLSDENVTNYRKRIGIEAPAVPDEWHSASTTQISVVDALGNAATVTTSTGSGSGYPIPGTGIMMNNMLGEEDLNPGGFHLQRAGERMSSMMSPTIVMHGDAPEVVTGSGGSNRIRSAILQVILNVLDFGLPAGKAVNLPRAYFDKGTLHVEHGVDERELKRLEKMVPHLKSWSCRDVFFGGAHSVVLTEGGYEGAGDERRGGVAIKN